MDSCYFCGASERFRVTRRLFGPRLRASLTFFGFGPVPLCRRCIKCLARPTDA